MFFGRIQMIKWLNKVLATQKRYLRSWFLTSLIGFSLALALSPPAAGQVILSDVQGHPFQACIEKIAQKQIISSYPDKTFRPSIPVSRAEFALAITQAFPSAPVVREAVQFSDVPTTYSAAAAIQKAYSTGFISGFEDRGFHPNQKILKSQVIVSLASGLQYSPTSAIANTLNSTFVDAADIPNYAQSAIAAAAERHVVVNYPVVKRLNPQQLVTRADLAALLCQASGIGLVPTEYIAIATTTPTRAEVRGVWLTNIDSDVLFERSKLKAALQRLRELNFNTIYPTIWNWGYTLYPSTVAKKIVGRSLDPTPGLQGRDMLKETVDIGHKSGLRVIPWFEFGFMAPADSQLAQRHPEWLTSRRDGTKIVKEGKDNRVWLNPFRPEVQQFIQDLIVETVSNYNIDGIQFDDHFGLPVELGYDSFTVGLYKQEHSGQSPSINQQDPEWLRWRADKITNFMQRLFHAIKNRKPNCIVSIAPNPQEFSYDFFVADWEKWERLGLVEELVLQLYRDDLSRLIWEMDHPEVKAAQHHIPVSIGLLSGLKGRFVPSSQILTQVQTVRDRHFAGVSFFFYESLWNIANEKPDARQSTFLKLFPTFVNPPNLLQTNRN